MLRILLPLIVTIPKMTGLPASRCASQDLDILIFTITVDSSSCYWGPNDGAGVAGGNLDDYRRLAVGCSSYEVFNVDTGVLVVGSKATLSDLFGLGLMVLVIFQR